MLKRKKARSAPTPGLLSRDAAQLTATITVSGPSENHFGEAEFRVVQHLPLNLLRKAWESSYDCNYIMQAEVQINRSQLPPKGPRLLKKIRGFDLHGPVPSATPRWKFTIRKDSHTIRLVCLAAEAPQPAKCFLHHTSVAVWREGARNNEFCRVWLLNGKG